MEMEDVENQSLQSIWSRVFLGKPLPVHQYGCSIVKAAEGQAIKNMDTKRSIEYYYVRPGKSCLVYKIGQWRWVLAVA